MAAIGVRVVNGVNSIDTGHMYIVLADGNGEKISYGFYPFNDNFASIGPGKVSDRDIRLYENNSAHPPDVSRDFYISESEYTRLKGIFDKAMEQGLDTSQPWGYYNPLTNSCVDFAWNAMREAGLHDSFFDGAIYPEWNNKFVDDIYYDFYRRPEFNRELRLENAGVWEKIKKSANDLYIQARNWIAPKDPLVLDLDGDGIEAIGIDPTRPILFVTCPL